jgi:uncharacterized protein (TIGR03083 family)
VTPNGVAASDYLSAYSAIFERMAAFVTDSSRDVVVPACPGWCVRDVLAHLCGVCEDWVNHRLDGYASEDWTSAQVERNAHLTCSQILVSWADSLAHFALLDEEFLGFPPARWALGDAVIHEADVRGALDSGRAPDDAVVLALEGTMARWTHEVLSRADVPALHVQCESHDWWLGEPEDLDAVVVEAPLYEVFRSLAGRRTKDQVRAWSWSSDPDPYLRAGLPYPFHWTTTALSE